MAIRLLESFDDYTTTAQLRKTYERSVGGFDATGGRFGGNALYANDVATYIQYQFVEDTNDLTVSNDIAIGFWFKATQPPAATTIMGCVNNQNRENMASTDNAIESWGWYIDTEGMFEMSRWQSNDAVRNTRYNVCDGQWHWIEMRTLMDTGTTGFLQCYIDGINQDTVEILNGASQEFGTEPYQQVVRVYANTTSWNTTSWLDDLIIYDDQTFETGDITPATDYPIGPVRIETLRPNGAGSFTQLTASAGANYTCVDDTFMDYSVTDDYVSSSTDGHTDTYAFENLAGSNIGTIHGVSLRMFAKNGGAGGTIQGRQVVYSGATEDLGPTEDLRVAYLPSQQYCFPRDPATAVAWTESGVNAAEFGFEVVNP